MSISRSFARRRSERGRRLKIRSPNPRLFPNRRMIHSLKTEHFREACTQLNLDFSRKDKLALVPVQYLLQLSFWERQCFLYISSQKATFRSISSCAISFAPWFTPETSAPAIAFPPAANLLHSLAFIAPRSPTHMPSWNLKA